MTTVVCFGCGNLVSEALNIWGQYLCPDCEAQMLNSDVNQDDYQHWIDVCRKFWENTRIDLVENPKK